LARCSFLVLLDATRGAKVPPEDPSTESKPA
jgi:hypothetical protein